MPHKKALFETVDGLVAILLLIVNSIVDLTQGQVITLLCV